jgi:hypothetical protein
MAQTTAQLQAQLGTGGMNATIIIADHQSATVDEWYVIGNVDAPGRARWCTTTASDSAATQAAKILTDLRA